MNVNEVILSRTVYLKRNLQNYNFALSLSDTKAVEIFHCIETELQNLESKLGTDYAFTVLPLATIDFLEVRKLQAKRILPYIPKNNIGKGIAFCKNCFVLINFDDHITIGKFCDIYNVDFDDEIEVLYKVENALQENLPFAFDEDMGFLTSSTDDFGTGFIIEFLFSLYFFGNADEYVEKLHKVLGGYFTVQMTERSFDEKHSSQFIFKILSGHSHYQTVESQIQKMFPLIGEAIQNEINDRENFVKNAYDEAYDFVLRAFLVAKNSILVPEYNFIDLLATIRFGIAAKMIKNMSLDKIDDLMIILRTPFIVETIVAEQSISMQDVTVKMIGRKRADILRKEFEQVKIKEFTNDAKFF